MKVLVIPDVHLKPKMFYRASAIMHQGNRVQIKRAKFEAFVDRLAAV